MSPRSFVGRLRAPALAGGVIALHWLVPQPLPTARGWMSLAHSVFTLALAILVVAIGLGLGRAILRRSKLSLDPLESIVVSFGLGLGVIGIATYVLGLVGAFATLPIALTLVLLSTVAARGAGDLLKDFLHGWTVLAQDWRQYRAAGYIVLGTVTVVAALALLLSLAPPWAYDGLMYHLRAPQIFLQEGRILPLPGILQANGPLLGQMLYGVGLALGTDTFAQVIHLCFGVILLLGVLALGRRLLGPSGGWLAAGILLGIPILPLWGTLAYVDMIAALYEFLAVWAICRWNESPGRGWLVLSAAFAGMAVGTKMMALFLLPALCLWLIALGWRAGWLRAILTGAAYGLGVAAAGGVWYLFNAIHLGDPLFPFLAGGAEWPAARVALHMDYLRSFGTGRNLLDFLELPWNLYLRHDAYAALMATIEFPSFLFPLSLLAAVVAPALRPLAGLSLLRLATWYLGSQQTRFLLPLYPVLALLTAAVLLALEARLRLRMRPPRVSGAITFGLIVCTLVYAAIYFVGTNPLPAVLGTGTRASFLERMVYDYRAHTYIASRTPPSARVLQLWDGQGYYCGSRCVPDAGQVQGPFLASLAPTTEGMAAELAGRGITHLLLDLEGLNFLLQHDPTGAHFRAGSFFLNQFLPACGQLEYEDPLVRIYRLLCTEGVPTP